MRAIKFRQWHHGRFHYWGFIGGAFVGPEIGPETGESVTIADALANSQQFTRLKDKQGKEIYEGDFLLIEDEYKDVVLDDGSGPTELCNHIAPVTFQDGSFGVRILEKGLDFDIGFWAFSEIQRRVGLTEFEIVGNLYKNPELLKEEEEPCLKLN